VPTLAVLTLINGVHVPDILGRLLELCGNKTVGVFWQNGPIAAKVGVIELVISISIVAVPAHCPVLGVKVYVVMPTVLVLIVLGFHVPVIEGLLMELEGKLGAAPPKHNGPIDANTGVIEFVISMSMVVMVAH
jgi:hypothetical protein